ncbi:MAG: cytochrome c-type biogenesis protein CcmH [Actinomycetota bacterium]|jgi:cytochrome c-type biogenesis protein CcmH/NrfF|nr:cytochrome c-type biogenesis protein CcmH [Actinomycetota bacterium]
MSSRVVWLGLAVAAVVLLAVGSVHGPESSASARVAYLESVLKCPSCEDLSITQSDAPSAVALRHRVLRWVDEGWSDAKIEQAVVSSYGEAELLVPPAGGVNATLYILPVALIGLATAAVGWHLFGRRRVERGGG